MIVDLEQSQGAMSLANIQMDTCWRAAQPDSMVWAHWNDDFIAYHKPSGLTHFLNAASKSLLTETLAQTSNTAAIVEKFLSPGGKSSSSSHPDEILAMLERLEQLGLVERV